MTMKNRVICFLLSLVLVIILSNEADTLENDTFNKGLSGPLVGLEVCFYKLRELPDGIHISLGGGYTSISAKLGGS